MQQFIMSASEFCNASNNPREFRNVFQESTTPETKALVTQVSHRIFSILNLHFCEIGINSLRTQIHSHFMIAKTNKKYSIQFFPLRCFRKEVPIYLLDILRCENDRFKLRTTDKTQRAASCSQFVRVNCKSYNFSNRVIVKTKTKTSKQEPSTQND